MVLMSRCVVTAVFFLLEGWLDEFEDFPKELSRSHMGRLAESEFEAVVENKFNKIISSALTDLQMTEEE